MASICKSHSCRSHTVIQPTVSVTNLMNSNELAKYINKHQLAIRCSDKQIQHSIIVNIILTTKHQQISSAVHIQYIILMYSTHSSSPASIVCTCPKLGMGEGIIGNMTRHLQNHDGESQKSSVAESGLPYSLRPQLIVKQMMAVYCVCNFPSD